MEKKIALVTGASSGIGKVIAIELANSGFEVIINFSKSKEKAKEVQQEITQHGGQAQIFQADITSEKDISELFNFIDQLKASPRTLLGEARKSLARDTTSLNRFSSQSVVSLLMGFFYSRV